MTDVQVDMIADSASAMNCIHCFLTQILNQLLSTNGEQAKPKIAKQPDRMTIEFRQDREEKQAERQRMLVVVRERKLIQSLEE